MFQPLSEAFVRRSWYSVLPVLDTTGRRRVKKSDYSNTGLTWNPKQDAHSLEAFEHQV